MEITKNYATRLRNLLMQGQKFINESDEQDLRFKARPDVWSKKEILGHLTDSGINNLLRFTTIEYENKPFPIRPYKQVESVKANDFQNADTARLLDFWLSTNNRIIEVILQMNENSLNHPILFADGKLSDLRFLTEDYIDHLEHHLRQIMK